MIILKLSVRQRKEIQNDTKVGKKDLMIDHLDNQCGSYGCAKGVV